MSKPAITVSNLGKCYRIGGSLKRPETALQAAAQFVGSPFRYLGTRLRKPTEAELLWALRGIDFEIAQGEVVGIIGKNGSGKSTLLKVLTRITSPTEGSAEIRGRVGSLLEVGTGFHAELTGRENIYMSGAILGMTQAEIEASFDEIVTFSGVERFIDTPVKRYSSGMTVRLGFAVAAHLRPENLLIDEVLAVGDASFRKKCLGKMGSLTGQGRTILFVSHNMTAVQQLCSRVIWLNGGRIEQEGPASDVVRAYLSNSLDQGQAATISLADREDREGNGFLKFTGIELRDARGPVRGGLLAGDDVTVVLEYESQSDQPLDHVSVSFDISDPEGRRLLAPWSNNVGQDFYQLPPQGRITCRIPRFPLEPGEYLIDRLVGVVGGRLADRIHSVGPLEVLEGDFWGSGVSVTSQGPFLCDQAWTVTAAEEAPTSRED